MFVLYAALMNCREGKLNEAMARRLQWEAPAGMEIVAEYWLQSAELTVVAIFQAESIAPMLEFESFWHDLFGVTMVPVVTAEEGLELARKMMG